MNLICFFVCAIYLTVISAERRVLELRWTNSDVKEFFGTVNNKSELVKVKPQIQVTVPKGKEVCSFMLSNYDGVELPFLAKVMSAKMGIANLIVIGRINRSRYQFTIRAKLCNSNIVSLPIPVLIKVTANEAPLWRKAVYDIIIYDNITPGTQVLQVHAYERGESADNSICEYKITAPVDAPFDIDGNGIIRTTDHMNANKHKNYVLRVSAIDCRFPKRGESSVSVNIRVMHSCKFGWNGLYRQINYSPSSGLRQLGDGITFDFCESNFTVNSGKTCPAKEVTVKLQLNNADIKRCDIDSVSLRNLWKQCGLNKRSIELLPPPDQFNREGHGSADMDTGIYTFDGRQSHWEIPTNVVSSDHKFGDNFTLSFWMRHDEAWSNVVSAADNNRNKKHKRKQHIICNSDGDGKNRHHYSMFLHNCKLILLYRVESDDRQATRSPGLLSPAEWRFSAPEFCDGHWHHYTVSVGKQPTYSSLSKSLTLINQVTLYVDGNKFPSDTNNPEIIDDVPMHVVSKVHFTKLTIGACWLSKSQIFSQYFEGQLAGMVLLQNNREPDSTIDCINRCHERLSFTGIDSMAAGTSISINSAMSNMVVTASNTKDVGRIIQKIGYINSRVNPIPGRRLITISTTIQCSNKINSLIVPDDQITIMVLAQKSINNAEIQKNYPIWISGASQLTINNKHELNSDSKGLNLLPDVQLIDTTEKGFGSVFIWGKATAEGKERPFKIDGASLIDSCVIYPLRAMEFPSEHLAFSNHVIRDLSEQGIYLTVTNNSHGIIVKGKQSLYVYQFILRRMLYFNSNLSVPFHRKFKLICSRDSQTKMSNTLTVKLLLSPTLQSILPQRKSYYLETEVASDKEILLRDVFRHQNAHSELAGLNSDHSTRVKLTRTVKTSYSNTAIIISVLALILLTVLLIGLLKMGRHKGLFRGVSGSSGPWVRLRPDSMVRFSGNGGHIIPAFGGIDDEEDLVANRKLGGEDSDLQITVNPLMDYEKTMTMFKKYHHLKDNVDQESQSLDELPDEYDGQSEDYHNMDDDDDDDDDEYDTLNIEDDCSSNEIIGDSSDLPNTLYRTGQSWSYNTTIPFKATTQTNGINIHNNPRYSFDSGKCKN